MDRKSTLFIFNENRKKITEIKVIRVKSIKIGHFLLNLWKLIFIVIWNKSPEILHFYIQRTDDENILFHKSNKLLFKLFLKSLNRIFSNPCVLWLNDPDFYYLRNFVFWKYLVLDYKYNANLNSRHFYESVFKKNLVFVYYRTKQKYFIKWCKKNKILGEELIWKCISSFT